MDQDENNINPPNQSRNFRFDEKLTQADVAFLLDIKNAGRVSEWENGLSNPGLEHSLSLGLIYHRQVEAIFYELYRNLKVKIEARRRLLFEKRERERLQDSGDAGSKKVED